MRVDSINFFSAIATMILLVWSISVGAQQPSLVAELEAAIEAGGADAVQQRFDEIWPDRKDRYSVDMNEFGQMVNRHARNFGENQELLNVLSDIGGVLAQAKVDEMMASPEMQQHMQAMQKAQEAAGAQSADEAAPGYATTPAPKPAPAGPDFGEARDDLERFAGLYGDPGNLDSPRKLFVTQTCKGHLLIGAMWGDVAPWQMTAATDTEFAHKTDYFDLDVAFEVDGEGQATRMQHSLDGLVSPLVRSGDLPADWQACVDRGQR